MALICVLLFAISQKFNKPEPVPTAVAVSRPASSQEMVSCTVPSSGLKLPPSIAAQKLDDLIAMHSYNPPDVKKKLEAMP
eukprot:1119148-Pyramimonas_sp.AAC.1